MVCDFLGRVHRDRGGVGMTGYFLTRRISWHIERRRFWIRLFGLDFAGKDLRYHQLFFSERNGYVKTYRFGNWSFKFLRGMT